MAVERELVIKFIGKDAGLSSTASVSSKAIAGLGESVKATAKSSKFLIDEQGRLKNAQGQFGDATKLSSKELEKLRSELLASGQNVKRFDDNLKETKANLLAFAGVAGGAGAAIAGIFGKGTQEFLAFEGGIKQAGVVGGASAEQLGVLRDEVERLGIVTSKAPAEIAQTSVSLSRAGFTAEETTAALEGVTRASEATGESLGTVGDIVSKTVRTFGLAADQAGEVGDILVATANNTNTTVSSIGESLSYVGAVAKASNQPLEDVAIAIGLLGDAGIQGSSAGTGLVAALDGLKQASAGATSEFTDLVKGNAKRVEAFQLIQTEVRNADGSMKSLIEILPILKANLGALSQQDQDVISKALFGVQGGRTIQTLLNTTDERVQQVSETIRNAEGQATSSGKGMLQGLGGALSLLQGSVGATLIKFGELSALGLEPLVGAAITVLNTFLGLPGPIQQVIVASTALTGVLAAAIAVYTTYTTLQVADKAAKIAGAAATATLSAAKAADLIVTNASAASTAVLTGAINAQNIGLAKEAISTGVAAKAKQAYAAATGTAGAATAAFAGRLALLAAQAALVVGAIYAVTKAFERSEGAKYANDLEEAVTELEKTRDSADESADSVSGLAAEYGRFINNIREKGPIEAVQIALVDLTGSTGRFGKQLRFITSEQKGAQLAQIATADALQRLGDSTQEATDLLAKFGQAIPDGRQLSPDELQTFTAAVADQSKALQEEIEVLEQSKGQSAELDQQLQNEISIRERLIGTLESRVAAQDGETAAVEAATDAARELSTVLDELGAKYDGLNDNAELTIDRAIADVATQEAEALLSQAEAERRIIELERTQLQASIDNNKALLEDLRAQRSQRTDPAERAALDDEILKTQQELAKNERQLAEERVQDRRDEAKEAKKVAEDAAKAQEKLAKETAKRQQQIAEDAAKKRADLLKQSQDDEARLREEAFGDQQRTAGEQFSDQQAATKQTFDDQLRATEAAFNDQQQAETARFEQAQQSKAEAFNGKQRAAEGNFKSALQAREEQFNESQRAREQAFSDRQQLSAKVFADQQSAQREAAEGRFAQTRLEIERQLELNAADPADREALEAKFKAEDEAAEIRRRAFAQLEAEEAAFEQAQRQAKIEFEQAQREEKQTFEEQQRTIQEGFAFKQQVAEEAFAKRLQETQRQFEERQQLAAQTFKQQQREAERMFEEEQRSRAREFQLVIQNDERVFEEQQREIERAFKNEQRQLDRENAQAVQAILDSASAASSAGGTPAQSLRSGGVAAGGVVQVHADEFLIPPRGTRVISQQESRSLVQQYVLANPLSGPKAARASRIDPTASSDYSGVPERLDTLIAAVRAQMRPSLQAGGNNIQIYGQPDPTAAAQKLMLDQVRALARL